jgi:hypothetical protein
MSPFVCRYKANFELPWAYIRQNDALVALDQWFASSGPVTPGEGGVVPSGLQIYVLQTVTVCLARYLLFIKCSCLFLWLTKCEAVYMGDWHHSVFYHLAEPTRTLLMGGSAIFEGGGEWCEMSRCSSSTETAALDDRLPPPRRLPPWYLIGAVKCLPPTTTSWWASCLSRPARFRVVISQGGCAANRKADRASCQSWQ